MSTEAALLAAVCATPDDDLPRPVYADWCDEQGRHVRADFIRSQIEMTRLEEWFRQFTTRDERKANGQEFGRRLSFLRRRVKGLLEQHREEAVGAPDGSVDITLFLPVFSTSRGFIDRLHTRPTEVRRLPTLLLRLAGPMPEVTVSGVEYHLFGAGWGDPLSDATGWEWVSTLEEDGLYWHEYGHHGSFPADRWARLADLPFPRLHTLNLRYWELTDELAGVLVSRFNLPALRTLDLMHNRLTPAGVRALSEARWWTGLHELSLSCSPPVRELVEVLTTARIPGLRSLTIGRNHALSGRVGEPLHEELTAIYPDTVIEIT